MDTNRMEIGNERENRHKKRKKKATENDQDEEGTQCNGIQPQQSLKQWINEVINESKSNNKHETLLFFIATVPTGLEWISMREIASVL